jgi:hypothetical protein
VDTQTEDEVFAGDESGSEDLDYNPNDDEVFADDEEHILEDVPVSNYNMICTKEII